MRKEVTRAMGIAAVLGLLGAAPMVFPDAPVPIGAAAAWCAQANGGGCGDNGGSNGGSNGGANGGNDGGGCTADPTKFCCYRPNYFCTLCVEGESGACITILGKQIRIGSSGSTSTNFDDQETWFQAWGPCPGDNGGGNGGGGENGGGAH